MSDRAAFEAEEIRGLAERYGGRRVPGKLGYTFSPLCWCCPWHERQELVLAEGANPSLGTSWSYPKGCARSTEGLGPCKAAIAGHHGFRESRP